MTAKQISGTVHGKLYPGYRLLAIGSLCNLAEAELQVRSAFLPGYIANSHTDNVAQHLVGAITAVSKRAGAISSPIALLQNLLGVAPSVFV